MSNVHRAVKRNNEMKNRYYIIIALLALAFTACQEEEFLDGLCKVRFVAQLQDEVSVTRADDTDNTYKPLSSSNYSSDLDASLYISFGDTHKEYEMEWTSNGVSSNIHLETGAYNFYGYAPKIDNATFVNSTKTLTIPSIPALYDKDLVVINPCSETVVKGDIGTQKTVPLKMDHLLAKITPCFYLNSEYAELRGIKIKEVEFFFDSAPIYTATISYTNSDYSTAWSTPSSTSNKKSVVPYKKDDSKLTNLPTTATEYGHFYIVPQQSAANLKMKVTYDVYDKSGILTRGGVTAINQIKNLPNSINAGTNYKLKIQVIPTYLYVLSDNDQSSVLVISNN